MLRREPNHKYIALSIFILNDPRLSLEGKGTYGMLESGSMEIRDVSENIIRELIEVGYLQEVQE